MLPLERQTNTDGLRAAARQGGADWVLKPHTLKQ